MRDSRGEITAERVLAVFTESPAPQEPLGTREVTEALGCARRTAYEKLDRLAEQGSLETKKVGGNVRVWWLPPERPARERTASAAGDLPELTSDHVLTLEFRSAALGRAFLDVSPDIEMRLDGIVERDDGTVLQYLTVSGASPRALFEMLEQYPHTIDLRLITRTGDEFRVEGHSRPNSMAKLFRSYGGTTKTAYLEDGEFVIVGEVPPSSDVAALAETAATFHPDIELANVELDFTPRLFRTVVEDRLTDRQWTTLTTAYYGGYFEQSRESTGAELAERLDITRQTFHHHLRNVQKTVFQTLLEGFRTDEERPTVGAGTDRSDQ